MEYDVPRSLDVPDQIGVPFFTTAQFAIFIASVVLAVAFWNVVTTYQLPVNRYMALFIGMGGLLLPRSVTGTGWTTYQSIVAWVGRWCRPRRAIWRPE